MTTENICRNGDPLVDRNVYWVQSRNLCVAVLRDGRYFTGIREKFGDRYLDTEVLNNPLGAGTVMPIALVGRLSDGMRPGEGDWEDRPGKKRRWLPNNALFDYLDSEWPTDLWWCKPFPRKGEL